MTRPYVQASPAILLLVLVACDPDKGDDSGDAVDVTDTPMLKDANNYSFDGSLTIGVEQITAEEDATVDWSALTEDLQGQTIDPAKDIDQAGLVAYRYLTPEEVTDKIETDTLQMADISVFLQWFNDDDETDCLLSEFTLFGNPVDVTSYMVDDDTTWMVLLAEGTTPGQGAKAMKFFEPTNGIDDHEIIITNDDTELLVEVDLQSLEQVAVPAGTTDITFDWSGLTTNARGAELDLGDIDTVWVAHYADLDVPALEDGFLLLETLTEDLWTYEPDGAKTASLADLSGDAAFEGLTTSGTWLFALRCSTCMNPAPLFLTVLDVR